MRGWKEGGGIIKGHKEHLKVIDMFIILILIISWAYIYVKTFQIVHFKHVQFIMCQLYLHNAVFKKLIKLYTLNMYRLLYVN